MGLVTTATLTAMLCLTCLASHPLQVMMQCGCLWSLLVSLSCSYYHLTCLPTLPNRIMATYTESGMTQTIRVLGKCYSAPSAQPISGWSAFASEFIGQLDDQFPQQLIVKCAHQADFLTLKIDLITINGQNRVWCWPRLGEMSFLFARNPTYPSNVAFSSMKVTWLSRSTKSPNGGESLPLDEPQREICCVKSASNLTISGNIWFSESQKTKKCELIFASIASDMLMAPQWSSRQISMMKFQGWSFGSSLRYTLNRFQHENSLSSSIKGSWL